MFILIITVLLNLILKTKNKEYYIMKFYKYNDLFTDLEQNLNDIDNNLYIIKISNKFYFIQDGKRYVASEYQLDDKSKQEAVQSMRTLKLDMIYETNDYIEFRFESKKDQYFIVYDKTENGINNYTENVHLKNNWYFTFLLNE